MEPGILGRASRFVVADATARNEQEAGIKKPQRLLRFFARARTL
jgi:hypothetical protein